MTRRALLLAPFLRPPRAGVHLKGRLDSTDSEQTERIANFGKACALIVHDQALWNAMVPMLGAEVQFSLFTTG